MRFLKHYQPISQSGQTLIETVVAIFMLVSGIAAAVGLAIFAFSSSQNVSNQMIAVGLAREGIEAVKNMRDTNWLRQTNIDRDCYNSDSGASTPPAVNCPASPTGGACCYKNWQREVFDIDPGGMGSPPASRNYRLRFDSLANFWDLEPAANGRYGLNFSTDVSSLAFWGFYTFPDGSGVAHTQATSPFARQIVINEDNGVAQYGSGASNPFNKDTGYRLEVISRVWWTDKRCPRRDSWPGLGQCSVELRTYLTNWKNY